MATRQEHWDAQSQWPPMIRKLVPIRKAKLLVLLYCKSITPPLYYLSSSCTVLLLMKKLIVREHTHIHTHTHHHGACRKQNNH